MKYVVEVNEHGIPTTDMGYHIIEAVKYQNWYNNNQGTSVVAVESNTGIAQTIVGEDSYPRIPKDSVPVGTIEFVQRFMQKAGFKDRIQPINIPPELNKRKFLQREMKVEPLNIIETKLNEGIYQRIFIKSSTKCKGFTGVIARAEPIQIPDDIYLISELVDIQAEWRVFVYRHKIMDAKLYSGEWTDSINIQFVKEAVDTYKKCSPAYCIDVALLTNSSMVVVEVHNLISCGLYGFEDYRFLPQMIASAYRYEIESKEM